MRRLVLIAFIVAGCDRSDTRRLTPLGSPEPAHADGLHNLFRVTDRLYSGSNPDGDAGFASLQKLGVKTVITVDGAAPDVATAAKYGIRYVHLPVGYDGITAGRAADIAKVVRDLPGPVYLHCHHGKHRGPAAAAVVARCLDGRSPEWAEAFLRAAGTDPKYPGLYAAAARPPAAPDDAPAAFPQTAAVPDLTKLMVEIDERWDALKAAKAASWPATAAADAVLLREHYREAMRLPHDRGDGYRNLLADAERSAAELEAALQGGRDPNPAFAASAGLCAKCHAAHRDPPK